MSKKFFERKIASFFPIPIIVVGVVMSLLGVAAIIKHPVIGVLNLAIGILFIFSRRGIQINFDQKLYREYLGIFGIKNGKWQTLPQIDLISITPSDTAFVNNAIAGGAQTIAKSTLLKVNLKYKNTHKIIVSSGSKEKVLKEAQLLSSILKVDILDCSEAEQKRISYSVLS